MQPVGGAGVHLGGVEQYVQVAQREVILAGAELTAHLDFAVIGLGGRQGLLLAQRLQHVPDPLRRAGAGKAQGLVAQQLHRLFMEQPVQQGFGLGSGQFGLAEGIEQRAGAVPAIAVALVTMAVSAFQLAYGPFAFARANEKSHGEKVGHLWNYGLNTWGWEGGHKGGDHDFNELVVQIDFTSAYGEGWLV